MNKMAARMVTHIKLQPHISARAKLGSGAVSSDMLSRARATLGIDDLEAKDLHLEAFGREVRVQLGLPEDEDEDDSMQEYNENQDLRVETADKAKEKLEAMKKAEDAKELTNTSHIKFSDGAFDTLSQLQEVLGLADDDADAEISAATTDNWCQTALATLGDAIAGTKSPSKAWQIIQARQKELFLKDSSMKTMMTSMVMQALGRPLEKVNAFARVNNAAATYDGLVDAIAAKETCKAVLKEAGWVEFEDFEAACFDTNDRQSACGFLTNADRNNMFSIFFQRSITKSEDEETRSISDEGYRLLNELRGMLGLRETVVEDEVRAYFGPQLQNVLASATSEICRGNTTDVLLQTLKDKVNKVIDDYQLDEAMVRNYAGPLYDRAVIDIGANAPGGVPTSEQVATLASLRSLLNVSDESAYPSHLETFGAAYKKGIKEALGTTGVIREEFRGPLEDLRQRIGVSEEAAQEIYLDALGERMKPMVEFIANEMERLVLTKEQLAQKRGVDFGEDYFKDGSKASVSSQMNTNSVLFVFNNLR